MDFKSCFYHVELDTCDSSQCLLCKAYIGGCTKYCQKCSQEKGICRCCGKPPIFIRDEALRAIRNFRASTTRCRRFLTEEVYASKMKLYEQLIQDIEEEKLNDNESIRKVLIDIDATKL